MYLGLKFMKQNKNQHLRDTVCVCACVPNFRQTSRFNIFSPNLPKNVFRVGNSENYCWNKNQDPRYTMSANFQSK